MLPPYIIEQIRQREERERQRQDISQPRLELPLAPLPARPMGSNEDDDPDRGVVVLDLMT